VANILHDTPFRWNPRACPHIHFIFLASRIIGLHFVTNDIGLCSLKFFLVGAARLLFLKEGCFRRSRSFKVEEFGANQKRVCDFLLVPNSNLGLILQRFGDFAVFMCS